MVYCCSICRQNLAKNGKRTDAQNNGEKEKPIVTTKCGHLFHPECLNASFQRHGNEVWASKECPVCKMTLTVATDLVRIFPSADSYDEKDLTPSVEELEEKVKKYEGQIIELRNMLEASFLRSRSGETTLNYFKKENAKLTDLNTQLLHARSDMESRIEGLNLDNLQLRNTVVSLSKNFAHIQDGGHFPSNPSGLSNPMQQNSGGGPPMPTQSYQYFQGLPLHQNRLPYFKSFEGRHLSGFGGDSPKLGVRGMSMENMVGHQDKMKKSVSTQQLNFNNLNLNFEVEGNEKGSGVEVNPVPIGNDTTGQGGEHSEITSSVDEFMDDLLLEGNAEVRKHKGGYHAGNSVASSTSGTTESEMIENSRLATQGIKQIYGKYFCERCKSVWGSSRSYVGRPQVCRRCGNEVMPFIQGPVLLAKK